MAEATAAHNGEGIWPPVSACQLSITDISIIEEAKSLAEDHIWYSLLRRFKPNELIGLPRKFLDLQAPPSITLNTLRRMVTIIEADYPDVSQLLNTTLIITPATAYSTFVDTADVIFQGGTNWGRIVAFYKFGGAVAHHLVEKQRSDMVQHVVNWTVTYMVENLLPWIREQGGWDAFVAYFSEQTDTRRKTLLALGSIFAACLAFLVFYK